MTGQPNDDLPGDVACALRVCADLEREASVLQSGASARHDAYVTDQVEEISNHINSARYLLRSLQSHVGWPSQPLRAAPRVLPPLDYDICEQQTGILSPHPPTRMR
jgi:hypothetical protein